MSVFRLDHETPDIGGDSRRIPSGSTLRYLKVSSLEIDPDYQRPERPDEIARIKNSFNEDAIGGLLVHQRADGRRIVFDGQQRLVVLHDLGFDDYLVACVVYTNKSKAWEAATFRDTNRDRSNLTPYQVIKAETTADDPLINGVVNTLATLGLEFANVQNSEVKAHARINCPALLMTIAEMSGLPLLREVLQVARDAWGADESPSPDGLKAPLIEAIWRVLRRYGETLDRRRLVARLGYVTPRRLLAEGDELARINRRTIPQNIAALLVKEYNKGLRHRLPDWPTRKFRRRYDEDGDE